MQVQPITAQDLRRHTNGTKHSAAGLDGWSPGELAKLPNYVLEALLAS